MPEEKAPQRKDKEVKSDFKSRIDQAIENAKQPTVKRFKYYIGPTGIWLLAYYFSSLFIMICLNIARVGWSGEAIFAAPGYFAQLFINYGLNAGKVDEFTYEKIEFNRALESASWLFSPWILYVLGFLFAILVDSGYPSPAEDYSYLDNYLYFHERTVALDSSKNGGFYFLIYWLPLIFATLIGAFISRRLFDKDEVEISVLKVGLFNIILGFIVGLQMGVMTGDYSVSFVGFFRTIFGISEENTAVIFTGHYHPNGIMIMSWFLNLVPLIIVAVWYRVYNFLEIKTIQLYNQSKKEVEPSQV
ncbi:MAG: hypothetical protein GF308_05210 [Candidatus Heimdallarchaeota archaeon]|nr:hypothetical protein [Candidatus Heimdallarchaeota archaeon]